MDFLNLARLRNVFSPTNPIGNPNAPIYGNDLPQQGGITGSLPTRPGDRPVNMDNSALGDSNDIADIMAGIFHPDNTYSTMYKTALDSMPQRTAPTKTRKVLGFIAGLGDKGPEKEEQVLYGDYHRNLGDWEERMKYLQPAMNYERYENSNDRSAAYQTAQSVLRERDIKRKETADAKTAEARDYANQIRAQVAKGGQFIADDKTHQGYMVYKDGTKVPIDITKLSPLEIEEFKQQGRMELANTNNAARMDIANTNNASREDIANLRNDLQMELLKSRYELMGQNKWSNPVQAFDKDNKPLPFLISTNGVTGEVKKIALDDAVIRTTSPGSGGKGAAAQSETQKAAGITNRARQIASNNPDWSKYIKFDTQGRFTGITRPGLVFGPNKELHDKIYQAVYGEPFTATPLKDNPGDKPKVGDTKTFPNGKVGKFDGKGWALVEEKK